MNLANSQEIRILELAQKIKQLTGSVSPIDFPSLREMLTKTGDGKLRLFVKSRGVIFVNILKVYEEAYY